MRGLPSPRRPRRRHCATPATSGSAALAAAVFPRRRRHRRHRPAAVFAATILAAAAPATSALAVATAATAALGAPPPPYPLGYATEGGVDSSPAACPRAHPRRALTGNPLSTTVEPQVLHRRSPPLRCSRAALHQPTPRHPTPPHAPHALTCTAALQVVGPPRTLTPSGGAGGRGRRRAGAPAGGGAGGRGAEACVCVRGGDRRGWRV